MNLRSLRLVVLLSCLMAAVFLCVTPGHAQTATGAVTGEVTDSTGAVIPNATVTVTNVDTDVRTVTQTNRDGVYTLRFLPIGTYKVNTRSAGFGEKNTAPFSLEINQTIKINTTLTVESSTTTSVTADAAPILNTTDGVVGTTFSSNEIQNFPLQDRNFQSVALYTPGVVNTDPGGMSSKDAIERSQFSNNLLSVNGNRGQANYYALDGVDINEPQNNQISYNPAPDSLQEIKVISGNAPAIYGNVNGGDIVSVLKSGTNTFHGSAYAYLQNWRFNADDWGLKHKTPIQDRTHYTETIFGGTFGGPVRIPHFFNGQDKLFFFGDFEGIRLPGAAPSSYPVLSPAELKGDFSAIPFQLYNTQAYDAATNTYPAFVGNQIPVNNPVAKFLSANPQYYPAANSDPNPGSYIRQYQATTRTYISSTISSTPRSIGLLAPTIVSRVSTPSRGPAITATATLFPSHFPP